MNTRKTFNGKAPDRQFNAPAALMLAVIILLAVSVLSVGIKIGIAVDQGTCTTRCASVGGEF